jgi:hypothetical protein
MQGAAASTGYTSMRGNIWPPLSARGSALGAARKSRGERLGPRSERVEARGQGLGVRFGVGTLAPGRDLAARFLQVGDRESAA